MEIIKECPKQQISLVYEFVVHYQASEIMKFNVDNNVK